MSDMRPPATLIVACASNNGIGYRGGLPWRLAKEMKYFAKVTTSAPTGKQNAVLMGRNTWDSIPAKFRPLKDRLNIVITSRDVPNAPDTVQTATSLSQALDHLRTRDSTHHVFIIGGSQLYKSALEDDVADRVLLTRILRPDYECDTFFPELDQRWKQAAPQQASDYFDMPLDVYERKVEESQAEWEYQMWTKK